MASKRAYIQANKDWLNNKAKEKDVLPLSNGIYYKVLETGSSSGLMPTVRSIVTAHYT